MNKDIEMQEEAWAVAVGLVVRQERRRLGLIQAELAYKSEIGIQTLHRLEHGKTNLTLNTLLRICQVMDISPAEVMQSAQDFVRNPRAMVIAIERRDAEPNPARAAK